MPVVLTPALASALASLETKLDATQRDLLRQVVQSATSPTELLKTLQDLATWQWKWRPVDTETFLLHTDYLGLNGQRGRIFPKLLADLVELFDDPRGYEQLVADGGIGWGKSSIAAICLARMVYEVSCLKNPQREYGLMDGATITLLNASVNLRNAQKVVFADLKSRLLTSPYFKEQFPFDANLKTEMAFPGNLVIMPVAGSEGGTVGYNVFGGVLDEVNFWQTTEKSLMARGGKFDQARATYTLLLRRIQSRFNRGGKLPGVLVQISSSKYPDDFTEIRRSETELALTEHAAHQDEPLKYPHPKTLVRRYALWNTKPRSEFLKEEFFLYRGSTADTPAISTERATFADKDQSMVSAIPMDFYESFKMDLLGSLRDLAGYPTLAIQPFLTRKDKLIAAFQRGEDLGLVHPFSVVETTLQDGARILRKYLRVNEELRYYAHVDLALKKDAAGVAFGHIAEWREVVRRLPDGTEYTDEQPVIIIDFMLRVVAPEGGEIGVDDVRALLLECRQYGINFAKITFDQYQSASSIQFFTSIGILSEKLSVDGDMAGYNALKEALYEDRLILYPYEPLLEELVRLEERPNGKRGTKVDHPPKGCFTGDTRVALIDGTNPTFEELHERYADGEPFWVYSVGPSGIQAGKAHHPRITKVADSLVEVLLDNYQVIRCTPDHLFMTVHGEWVQAQNLTPDVSIMPLYRSRAYKGGQAGYERLWCPTRDERLMTHQLVAGQFGIAQPAEVIHHINEHKYDNRPENLLGMTKGDHASHHTLKRHQDARYVAKLRAGHATYRENGGNEKSRANIQRLFDEGKLKRGRAECAIEGCLDLVNAKGMCDKHYQAMRRVQQQGERTAKQVNHRAMSVTAVKADTPVWDITVDETHNFALASGVFVHNSKDVSDGVAGVVYHCTMAPKTNITDPTLGESYTPKGNDLPKNVANPAAGMSPTVVRDAEGNEHLLPGKKRRTLDDVMFNGCPGYVPPSEDDEDDYIGFA